MADIPNVAFRVPNNKRGQRFLRDMREFINRDRFDRVRARGRGGGADRGRHAFSQPLTGCKWMGIYLDESKSARAEARKYEDKRTRFAVECALRDNPTRIVTQYKTKTVKIPTPISKVGILLTLTFGACLGCATTLMGILIVGG